MLAGVSFAAFAGAFVTTPIVVRGAAEPALTTTPLVSPVPVPSAVAVVLPRRDPFTGDAPRATVTATTTSTATPSYASAPAAALPPIPRFPAIPGTALPGTGLPTSTLAGGGIPAALGPLPPNTGALNGPLPSNPGAPNGTLPLAAQTARVTAVVTGAHPFALVEDAGATRLVTVGDRIAGDAIAAITAGGVRLANGSVLAIAPVSSPIRPGSGGR
jgi:hypothetical protein